MDIRVSYSQGKTKEEAFAKARNIISSEYLKQWNLGNVEVTCYDKDCKIVAKGKDFNMTLTFAQREARAEISLPLSLSLFKSVILKKIQTELEKYV